MLLHPPTTTKFHHLVAFGAGLQISLHIRQLLETYPSLLRITIVNRTVNARLNALREDLQRAHPGASFEALSRADAEAAVRQADIICCATPSTTPLFPSEWVRPGTHIVLVGSYKPQMEEIDTALVNRARVILVDSRSACAIEAGELIDACVQEDHMVEVGELLSRTPPARDCAWEPDANRLAGVLKAGTGDVTIFKSVGIGGQDVAITVATVERAMEMGIGTTLPDWDT